MSFERFSERARSVITAARDSAIALGHNYIGTEHLLLGELAIEQAEGGGPLLDREVDPEAVRARIVDELSRFVSEADALRSLGIDPTAIVKLAKSELDADLRIQGLTAPLKKLPVGIEPGEMPEDALPFTARVFKILNLAVGLACGDLAEPTHLLRAIVEDDGGLAVIVLDRLGVDLASLEDGLTNA